jgi:DedD protein
MTSAFKNRLIGSSIIIIAAIVFLPDLLDGQKQVVKGEFKAIPQRPEFATVQQEQVFTKQQLAEKQQELLADPLNEPALDETLPDTNFAEVTAGDAGSEAVIEEVAGLSASDETAPSTTAANPLAAATTAPTTVKAPAEKAVEPKGNPALNETAWIVRVGSFSKADNATALVAKLKAAGFTTFTRSTTNAQGQPMVSVVVGPELKKERLEHKLAQLQQLTGIEGLKLTAFKPIENN